MSALVHLKHIFTKYNLMLHIFDTYVMITTLERPINAEKAFSSLFANKREVLPYFIFCGRLYKTICHGNPVMGIKFFEWTSKKSRINFETIRWCCDKINKAVSNIKIIRNSLQLFIRNYTISLNGGFMSGPQSSFLVLNWEHMISFLLQSGSSHPSDQRRLGNT